MPDKTSVPGVEQISPNTYRYGVQQTVIMPDGSKKRKWIRETRTYDPSLTMEQQLALVSQDFARFKDAHGRGVGAPAAIPAVPIESIALGSGITVTALCSLWQQTVLPGASADYARSSTSLISRHIIPHIGPVPVEDLTPLRISMWVATLQRKSSGRTGSTLSDKTVRHCYITMATVCNWAVTMDILKDSPFRKAKPPRARRTHPRFLSDEQAIDLLRRLAAEEDMSFRCAVMLGVSCGLRLGEVGALTWSDVDFKHATIDISKAAHTGKAGKRTIGLPKTDDSIRIITAPAAMMALLHEARADQQARAQTIGDRYHDHDLIVCNWDGSPLAKDTPSRQWRRFADAAGYTGVTFHNLRTTHATLLMASGIDAVAIASRLGHSDATTTLRYYTMVVDARDRAAADAIDALFSKTQK